MTPDLSALITRAEEWMRTTSPASDNHETIDLVVDMKRALEFYRDGWGAGLRSVSAPESR